MTVNIHVISDFNGLLEIEDSWNEFIYAYSKNPFFFSGFVKQFMEFNSSRGWSTLVFVVYANNTIVGIVPLVTKKKFGVRFVKFLSGTWPWAD